MRARLDCLERTGGRRAYAAQSGRQEGNQNISGVEVCGATESIKVAYAVDASACAVAETVGRRN